MTRYPALSAFAAAFAAEYKGFMRANGVTNLELAAALGRKDGYVSERANGKRPLDTADVDALASLVPGWSGRALIIELAKRARVGTATPPGGQNVITGNFGQQGSQDDELAAASESANTREDDRTDEHFF